MKAKFFQLLEEMNKADPRFTVYAKALLFYYMPNQGELFITHNWYIADLLGIHEKTLLKAKKELVNRGVICVDPAYSGKKNNRISGTYVTVNYDWKTTNDRILNDVIQNNVIQNDVIQNDVILNNGIQRGALIREKDLHRENDLPRENDLQGKDLTREKAEGAAAKPQPAPALPEGAENVPEESAAQNTPGKAASQGCSNTETAQGQQNGNKYQLPLTDPEVIQTDLFGVPERAPGEKPKKGSKGKGKAAGQETAGEIEIPTLEQVAEYITKYITEKKAIEFWTVYEIQLTAEKILNNPKAKKWKDWRQGVRNWIMGGHKGAFRPEVVDPARFDKGNQPGQTFQQTQQGLAIESVIEMVESGIATVEGLGITNPETVSKIKNEIARRRGNTSQEIFEAESVRTLQD